MNTVQGGRAKCPFYLGERKCAVCCEGFGRAARLVVEFSSQKSKAEHERIFCNSDFNNCALAQLINDCYKE